MSKYLIFILIGIILFLLSNNKNGFNIGVPEYHFISGELISQVDERAWTLISQVDERTWTSESEDVFEWDGDPIDYHVWAEDETGARRKLERHTDLNTDGATLVDIRLTTPAISVNQHNMNDVVCEPNYRCIISSNTPIFADVSFDYCEEQFEDVLRTNCMFYHSNNYCKQNCSFVISNNPSKTLERDGFEKIPELVTDLNPELSFTELEYSNTGLLYAEYLFKLFIERINPGSNLHKFRDGIYFINGKIVICRFTTGGIRIINIRTTLWDELTDEQRDAASILGWDKDTWNNQLNNRTLFTTKNIWEDLATEAGEGQVMSEQDAATTLGYDEFTWGNNPPYHEYYTTQGSAFPLLHMDFQKYIKYDDRENLFGTMRGIMEVDETGVTTGVDEKTSKYHFFSRSYANGILFNTNEKSKSINLWLLLEGSRDTKTMGFIDIIDDDDSNKYNADTLRDMQRNDLAIQRNPDSNIYSMVEFPDRLTPYFQTASVQFPNVLNMQTSNNTLDPTKPNINPNKLHTYDMMPGDVLAFRSDIPHLGFKDVRTSVEFRYDYVEIDVYEYMKDKFIGGSCAPQSSSELAQLTIKQDEIENKLKEFLDPDDVHLSDILYTISDKINVNLQVIFSNFRVRYTMNMSPDKYKYFNVEMFKNLLNFLNGKPTLNLYSENNPDYSGSLTRLRDHIDEFLRRLDRQ